MFKDLDLEELLADPLVRLVMSSDGVQEADIRQLARRLGPHRTATRIAPRRIDPESGETGSWLRHAPSCRYATPSPRSAPPPA